MSTRIDDDAFARAIRAFVPATSATWLLLERKRPEQRGACPAGEKMDANAGVA